MNPNEAGMLSFKLSIHNVSVDQNINFSKFDSWIQKPSKGMAMKLRAYIYQCQDLPAADSGGTSDPFLRIWDLSQNAKETQVSYENNNPLYFEVIELIYEVRDINDKTSYPPFIIDVWDRDENLITADSNDFLGRCIIKPQEAAIKCQF